MPKIITLAKTKELLGITDTSQDTEINRYIPIIDAKVKLITKNRYNVQVFGSTVSGSNVVELNSIQENNRGIWSFGRNRGSLQFNNCNLGINNNWCIEDLQDYLEIGTLISGDGVASDSYVDEVYYNGLSVTISSTNYNIPAIEMSENATATSDNAQIFLSFNIGLQTTVAKGIQWLIDQENTNEPGTGWSTRRMGPVSVTKGVSQAKIDGRYGMPTWFVKAFPVYVSGH